MPEEVKEEQPPKKAALGGLIKWAAAGFLVVLAGVGGFATYYFVLAPRLATTETEIDDAPRMELPLNPVMVTFEQNFVNVIMEADLPASILIFGVTLECANEKTSIIVEAWKPRFMDLLNKLHDSHKRSELDDTRSIKESIQSQAMQQCNSLLKQLQPKPDPEIRITGVLHDAFTVEDK